MLDHSASLASPCIRLGGCCRAWIKGVAGKSPSFDRAYASVGLQYLPLVSPGGCGWSGFGAGYLRDENNWAFTVGPGLYWNPQSTPFLLGGSLFYDARNIFGRYYSQIGASAEVYFCQWRAVVNGYMPAGRRIRYNEPVVYTGFPRGEVVTAQFLQTAVPLFEGLIGRCFQPHPNASLDLQFGIYNLSPAADRNYIGLLARARVEGRWPIFVEAQLSKDPWFRSRGQVAIGAQVRWRQPKCRRTGCCDPCQRLFCPRPLQRKEWVIINGCCNYTLRGPR